MALDLEGDLDAKINRQNGEADLRVMALHMAEETHLLDLQQAIDPIPLLKELEDTHIYVHGAEFDIAALHHRYGFTPKHVPKDTLNLSRLIYAGEETSHKLLDCLERELDLEITEEDRNGKQRFQRPPAWREELTEDHARYAAGDVDRLQELYEALLEKIERRKLTTIKDLEDRARPAFLSMQFRGVPVDTERWIQTAEELRSELDNLRARILDKLPDPPDEEGWKLDGSGTKRGPKVALEALGYTVDNVQVSTLRQLAAKTNDGVVNDLVRYREKSTALKYIDWPERFFVENRIYPIINPHGAEDIGRATTRDPNLQGLDKGGQWRQCIRPEEGQKIIRADLAQIELRIMAYVSGDKDLFEALNRGDDLHKMSAETAVGRKLDLSKEEDKALRTLAKRVNFGRFYGAGPRTITKNLNDKGVDVTEKDVKNLLEGLEESFPRVAEWQDEFGNRPEMVVKSVLGRRRRVSSYNGRPSYTERLNAPIQTTGTDILKTALAKLAKERGEHPDIESLLSVHDEVLLEAPAGEKAQEAKGWLEDALRGAVAEILGPEYVGVPGKPSDCAEAKIQNSWGGD